ncbi:MAG: DUF6377 domain-containing protein [Prevotellaceae bacterium]|jgi:hypothetical protein|nr:DUF6377 domain-containing protein [Prevotellaceae bacterium]
MKNIFTLALLLVAGGQAFAAGERDSLLAQLDEVIGRKAEYDRQKEQKLLEAKQLLNLRSLLPVQAYDFNREIAGQYSKYIIDSAIHYMQRSCDLAAAVKRPDLAAESALLLSHLYTTAGMYIEAKNTLLAVDRQQLPTRLLSLYFEVNSAFYGYYAQSNNQHINYRMNHVYLDSLLASLDTASVKYKLHAAERLVYLQAEAAVPCLLAVMGQVQEGSANHAMAAYLLGMAYGRLRKSELQQQYLATAAIIDIRSSVKDHAALQELALSFYETGNVDRAYAYIKSVVDDISFGRVRFRMVELANFYAAINTSYLTKEMRQKKTLQRYLLVISSLLLALIVAGLYGYRQMKRVSRIKKELSEANLKLADLNKSAKHINSQLQKVNAQLSEANHIKEEYIAHFFDMCSVYIDKLESYRKDVYRKVANRQHGELVEMLKSTTLVDEERKKLYETFDIIFLNLYPSFVEDFNSLLGGEEKVVLKPGERLNTELRIFALIRLGITDSMKIAAFLRYSVSTIYNYRTRARNRFAASRYEFEELVAKIGNIHEKS